MSMLRVILSAILIVSGLFVLGVATLGLFRLRFVLNRMHAAAKCDTLGALLVLAGAMVLLGPSLAVLKLVALIVFVWLTSPVAVYLIAHVEVETNPHLSDECEVKRL